MDVSSNMPAMAGHPDKIPRRGSRNTLKKKARKVVEIHMMKPGVNSVQECNKAK